MNVVSFPRLPERRDNPDQAFVSTDANALRLYRFALQYEMDGKRWATEIWAYSSQDAEDRVAAMRRSLMICGQLYAAIDTDAPSEL